MLDVEKLRESMQQQLASIPIRKAIEWSDAIYSTIVEIPVVQEATGILIFIPSGAGVRTHGIVEFSLNHGKRVFIATPVDGRIVGRAITRDMYMKRKGPGWTTGSGLLWPMETRKEVHGCADVDAIIVPGLAFDMHGRRVGFEEDPFISVLESCGTVHRIGVAFEFQILPDVPECDGHIDTLVTEKNVYTFRHVREPA